MFVPVCCIHWIGTNSCFRDWIFKASLLKRSKQFKTLNATVTLLQTFWVLRNVLARVTRRVNSEDTFFFRNNCYGVTILITRILRLPEPHGSISTWIFMCLVFAFVVCFFFLHSLKHLNSRKSRPKYSSETQTLSKYIDVFSTRTLYDPSPLSGNRIATVFKWIFVALIHLATVAIRKLWPPWWQGINFRVICKNKFGSGDKQSPWYWVALTERDKRAKGTNKDFPQFWHWFVGNNLGISCLLQFCSLIEVRTFMLIYLTQNSAIDGLFRQHWECHPNAAYSCFPHCNNVSSSLIINC